MQTCVYLSNRSIQIAVGTAGDHSVTVRQLYETEAPEGSIINGVITSEEELAAHLGRFWHENRIPVTNVSLTLYSSQFSAKVLKIPAMKYEKTLQYLPREFQSAEGDGPKLYSYYTFHTDRQRGLNEVFATRMERSFLDSYIHLFRLMGVKIRYAGSALGGAISVLHRMEVVKGRTCIVQIQDEDNLTSILFDQGQYCYSSVSRTFSEHGTPGYGVEVARNVSGILQFASSQKLEHAVTDVYWAGFSAGDTQVCLESLAQMDGRLKADCLKDDRVIRTSFENYDRFLLPVCGLLRQTRESNLYAGYVNTSKSSQNRRAWIRRLTPSAVILVIMLLISGTMALYYRMTAAALEETMAYNQDPSVLEQSAQYDALDLQIQQKLTILSSMKRAQQNIESYPSFNNSVNQVLGACAAGQVIIDVKSYDAASGAVQVDTKAPQVDDINRFIDRLEEQDIFERVDYTGYVMDEQEGNWTINLVCYLAESAGKQ